MNNEQEEKLAGVLTFAWGDDYFEYAKDKAIEIINGIEDINKKIEYNGEEYAPIELAMLYAYDNTYEAVDALLEQGNLKITQENIEQMKYSGLDQENEDAEKYFAKLIKKASNLDIEFASKLLNSAAENGAKETCDALLDIPDINTNYTHDGGSYSPTTIFYLAKAQMYDQLKKAATLPQTDFSIGDNDGEYPSDVIRDKEIKEWAKNLEKGEKLEHNEKIAAPIKGDAGISSISQNPEKIIDIVIFATENDDEISEEIKRLAKASIKLKKGKAFENINIWNKFEKAMQGENFDKFILNLKETGVLKEILPEVDKLWQMPEKLEHHPEGNSGAHTLLTLKAANKESPKIKFAMLLHDIGKSVTPEDVLPAHIGHEKAGLPIIEDICERISVPEDYKDFALFACKEHMKFKTIPNMKVAKVYDFVKDISDNFANKEKMQNFIKLCECDAFGRGVPNAEELVKRDESMEKFKLAANRANKVFDIMQNVDEKSMPNYETAKEKNNFDEIYKQHALKSNLKDI